MSSMKLDREAFKRGVEDMMTLAPLRDALKRMSGTSARRFDKPGNDTGHPARNSELDRNVRKSADR